MKYTKPVTEVKTFVRCDFCDSTTEKDSVWMDTCVVCGKDICNCHDYFIKGEKAIEDGCLCPDCSKVYKFTWAGYGGIGVINRKTGKLIEACYI